MTTVSRGPGKSGVSRRAVLQTAMAGAAALAMPAVFTGRAFAATGTLRVLSSNAYRLADAWQLTEAPEKDATYLRATWDILQAWKQKHPDVQLQIEEFPPTDAAQAVILAAQGGAEADVVTVNDLNIPKLARGGFLLPMDDFDGQWDEYNQTLLRGIASFDGKIYAAPWMTDCRHEMYWKSDFEAAGIAQPGGTWAEFTEQMSALKAGGVANPYAFFASNSVHTPTQSLLAPLWMLGGDVLDADGRAKLNTPELVEVFGHYNSLMNEAKVSSTDLIAIPDSGAFADLLVSHKVAASKNGAWIWQNVVAAGHGDDIGYFRTPRPTADAKDVTLSGFWGWLLPARNGISDTQQELAAEFAIHMSSNDSQALTIAQTEGQLPTRVTAAGSPQAAAKDDAWRFQAAYAGESGRGMPPAADGGLLFDQMRTAFQRYLTGETSAEDALTAAETSYNSQVS